MALTLMGGGYTTNIINADDWLEYIKNTIKYINDIKSKKNILEVGCGAGAFLKGLEKFIDNDTELFAIDYSINLINIAKNVLKNCNFSNIEAIDIDKIYNNNKFDLIFSNSVFQYFENEKYVFDVINKMYNILKPNGDLILLDLNDLKKESDYHKLRIKATGISEDEYNKQYSSLRHLFFDKTKLFNYIDSLGFKKIIIEDQNINNYSNNSLRFNIIAIGKK